MRFPPRCLSRVIAGLVGSVTLLCLATVARAQAAPAAASPTPSVQALAASAQSFTDELLAAARQGDGAKVDSLLNASFTRPAKFSKEQGNAMTDALLRAGDLPTFTVLRDALAKTNYGNNWRISDELLAGLVRDKRTDFLDVLLARRLDLDRLTRQAKTADPDTAAWINRRVAETTRQRADLETLARAAKDGDLPAVQRLLDAGVDVNGVDKDNNTPLIEAVFKNRLDAARLLLDHGALVDKVRFPGWDYTPLCLCNSLEMARLLKDHGANVHATLFHRPTSILTYVAMWTDADLVEWFLQQGLDPKMLGDNKQTLLFGLADGRTAELLLKAGVDPNQADEFGLTPICWARSEAVAQALIDHGAKLTGLDKPLLPSMIQFGSGGAVEAALKAGADHDPKMLQQALISAAHMDRDEIVTVLLNYGAKPNEPGVWSSDTDTLLPLQVCTIFGSQKTAKILLDAGADPNGGKAPGALLKNAMSNGYKEVARLLRDAGAGGVSDLAFSLALHDTAQVKTLLATAPSYQENPAFWDDALPDAARVGDVDTVRAALAHGVPLTSEKPTFGHEDAYAAAAGEGRHEALAILLAARPPDANPDDLRWALWEAVWNCHPYEKQRVAEHFEQCVEMLLAAHAPVTGYAELQKGMTDLMSTAVFSRNPGGNPKVMEMLVRAGVDPNPVLKDGEHPDQPGKPLLTYVQESCAKGYCSTPVADTLVKLCQLAAASSTQPPAPAP